MRSSVASTASTAAASPCVFRSHVPMSSSLVRSDRIASSSSRAIASGHHARAGGLDAGDVRRLRRRGRADGERGGARARDRWRRRRARSDSPRRRVVRCERRERDAVARRRGGRCAAPARARARCTAAANCAGLATASTSRQSSAFWPRTPSVRVQKMSARSCRTWRLSVTRVRPPVPGSTPSSGTSGSATLDERSSTRKISSQASASS